MNAFLDRVAGILEGEPARIIGYGAAVIIYLVARFSGAIPDQTPDEALSHAIAALAVAVSIVESIRHYVSPVAKITP